MLQNSGQNSATQNPALQNALSQLHDIQTPEAITWWPLAWGWWLVIAIVLALLVFVISLVIKRYKLLKAKKQALSLLQQAKDLPATEKVKAVNTVLKRVALAYVERDNIAQLSTDEWSKWLNQFNEKTKVDADLLSLIYQRNCSEQEAKMLHTQAVNWINKVLPISKSQLLASQQASMKQKSALKQNQEAQHV